MVEVTGPTGSWRTRWSPPSQDRDRLRRIIMASNPIFEPVQQYPVVYVEHHRWKAYRQQLFEHCMDSGDPVLQDMARNWLAPNPIDVAREVFQDFLDRYPGFPVPHFEAPEPRYNPYQYIKMEDE